MNYVGVCLCNVRTYVHMCALNLPLSRNEITNALGT